MQGTPATTRPAGIFPETVWKRIMFFAAEAPAAMLARCEDQQEWLAKLRAGELMDDDFGIWSPHELWADVPGRRSGGNLTYHHAIWALGRVNYRFMILATRAMWIRFWTFSGEQWLIGRLSADNLRTRRSVLDMSDAVGWAGLPEEEWEGMSEQAWQAYSVETGVRSQWN
jgi:hypothetical protein